jgi:hypothetical protein
MTLHAEDEMEEDGFDILESESIAIAGRLLHARARFTGPRYASCRRSRGLDV